MKTLSPTLKKLVKALNASEFLSGASLGKILSISRNAIWKHVNQLTKYGVAIETAQSKGYYLKQPLILLDKSLVKKNLTYTSKFLPNKIEILGSITSTSDYLKELLIDSPNEIVICLAEHQSAGRGRFGRAWYSPFGTNIYLSCRWCVAKDVSQLNGLSLVAALSVINALKEFKIKDGLSIKWPNDILWKEKKLGGILTEINAESYGLTQIIIGIGLNVNMSSTAKDKIDHSWTSLNQITSGYHDRNKIAGLLIGHLMQSLEKFNEIGFASFDNQWKKYDYLLNKKINIAINKNNIKGIAQGVNEQGHLLLRTDSGVVSAFSAGETSLHAVAKSMR